MLSWYVLRIDCAVTGFATNTITPKNATRRPYCLNATYSGTIATWYSTYLRMK
jgi:hypothetical protein